jgi:hypothetical protein
MDDGPEWFAPKRNGYGAGWPISWQGWALTLGFIAIMVGTSVKLCHNKLVLFAIMVPVTFTFVVVVASTTKGGWRWRSGEEE